MYRSEQMAADTKEVLDRSVNREEPLRVGSRFELAHLTLPLPGRLVGDFRPIVRVLVRAVDHRWHHGAAGCWITAQFGGDQSLRIVGLEALDRRRGLDARFTLYAGVLQDLVTLRPAL